MQQNNSRAHIIYACIAGFSLFIIAMGINRFSYAPIIPYLVNSHWLTTPQGGYVGSANFLGYFLGAYSTHKLTRYFSIKKIMIVVLIISVIASTLCMINFGYIWLSIWRLVVGIVAGIIMVLTPTIILENMADKSKAIISGIMFSGIGIGIALTSWLIPHFNQWGNVISIWTGLAVMTLLLALLASAKCIKASNIDKQSAIQTNKLDNKKRRILFFAVTGYGLYGVGLAPSLLFLSDYAHRVLGVSTELSSLLFAILGIGCAVGSIMGGWIHNKFGNYYSVLFTSAIGIVSLLLITFTHSIMMVAISAFLTGFYLIALVVLMSLFVESVVGMPRHAQYWALMTLVYAGSQFVAGYIFSYALNFQFSYHDMFISGFIVLILSLISYMFIRQS